ncbi:MAG TPA: chemotaxis protein CheB [Chitinophagaceae bacterium]|nr:chemotaxis protein CheB [Chitinophagaceae bacterium]
MTETRKIIVIGGSAGSLSVVLYILQNLPSNFIIPIVIILHRLKNIPSEIDKIISLKRSDLKVKEPDDKEPVYQGYIYIAPANYHLLVETDATFSLDYSEPVHYSRPSIDVTFESVAQFYGSNATAVLLSGANEDGTAGLFAIIEKGGTALVQSPESSEYPIMPAAAIRKNEGVQIFSPQGIVKYLEKISPF